MRLGSIRRNWQELGEKDPFWAVLTTPEKRGGRWDADAFFATGRREIASALQHIAAGGLNPPRERALDFGCGVGRLTQALAEHFSVVDGVDVAPSMIAEADRLNKHGERCRYRVNDSIDLGVYGDGTFDLVYSNITLQHMPPSVMKRYLAEFVRVLSPEGVLYFELTTAPSMAMRLKARAYRASLRVLRKAGVPMYWASAERVSSWLRGAGARLVDVAESTHQDEWVRLRYIAVRGR